jgi:hypothetical protein
MLATMALAIAAAGYGQNGTNDPNAPVQDPAQQNPQQSVYHDCLVSAGPYTWKVLGLDEDQVNRISAVQTRYKESLEPAKDTKSKKDKEKGKKEQAARKVQNPAVSSSADQPAVTQGEAGKSSNPDVNVRNSKRENVMPPAEGNATAEGSEGESLPPTVTDELQSILTPEQWARWDRQCAHPGKMSSLTP